jgi:hypothetical protein
MKSLSFRAHQKGLELVYEVQPDVPEPLLGDPSRIRSRVNRSGNLHWRPWRNNLVLSYEEFQFAPTAARISDSSMSKFA